MKKVLVLFPNDWDRAEFAKSKYNQQYQFLFFGPKLFDFPHPLTLSQSLKLPFFNAEKFVKKVVRKAKREKVDAILSSEEYIGAIIAAVASQELGLPGNDASTMILSQHKYLSRLKQKESFPEAAVNCDLIPLKLSKNFAPKLKYPFFVKPVKGTFSLYAKKINNEKELRSHMSFNWLERFIFRMINRPYNQLLKAYSEVNLHANYFVAEELLEGDQVTLDGFVHDGKFYSCGIVDSVMYPNTNVFSRFEYPSKLSQSVQDRMVKLTEDLITTMGFKQAQFNVELFYNPVKDSVHIIDVNRRLSYQFSELYENVEGNSTYQILIDLALGKKPSFGHGNGSFNCSTSFVLRTFTGNKLTEVPDEEEVNSFCERYPKSSVKIFGKVGTDLSGEMRSVGGYRCGIVNLGANSPSDLSHAYEEALESLSFSVA